MKKDNPIALIEESIRLELNVAELYRIFLEGFPEDATLWQKLHREEKNHARLLRTAKDSFLKHGTFPAGLVADCLETLAGSNATVEGLVEKHAESLPSRTEACRIAIRIEESAGECHYLKFMKKQPDNGLDTVLQLLNQEDTDHAKRLREHLGWLEAPA